jgi:hypothetical protein
VRIVSSRVTNQPQDDPYADAKITPIDEIKKKAKEIGANDG